MVTANQIQYHRKVREIFPTEETLQIFGWVGGWVLMGPLGTCFKSMIEPLQI